MQERQIETAHGPAVAHIHQPAQSDRARALVVLGPGASGSVGSPDLVAVTEALTAAGVRVAVVTPPYAVAGRKVPPRGTASDEAWLEIVAELEVYEGGGIPLITGGRSYGSRVACRTSTTTGSIGVLCLSFPLHPPGKPENSRLSDLEAATVPTLIMQGRRDPFGMPPEAEHRRVVVVEGHHSPAKKELPRIAGEVVAWVDELLGASDPTW